jgi:uncharacterized RDD family membrane protein YckC
VDREHLSVLPPEARSYQGAAAGIATRVAASTIDGLIVVVSLLAAYGGYVALRLVLSPRTFHAVDHTLIWAGLMFVGGAEVYLTLAWWIGGRTIGNRVMGLQVVSRDGGGLGFFRALARAVLCVVFPVGLLWSVVDPARRSLQDLVLRTKVVYNWLPRATAAGARHAS